MSYDPIEALWWLTVVKILIGIGFGSVLVISLYKFKALIMTTFGLLLLSNLLSMYLLLAVMSK